MKIGKLRFPNFHKEKFTFWWTSKGEKKYILIFDHVENTQKSKGENRYILIFDHIENTQKSLCLCLDVLINIIRKLGELTSKNLKSQPHML